MARARRPVVSLVSPRQRLADERRSVDGTHQVEQRGAKLLDEGVYGNWRDRGGARLDCMRRDPSDVRNIAFLHFLEQESGEKI